MSRQSSILISNIQKGRIGEQIAKEDYEKHGFKTIRTGRGSDFMAIKRINGSRKSYTEFVEVKTGRSRQSKKQIITMRRLKRSGKKYTVYRISDVFLTTYLNSITHSSGEISI